MQLGYLITVALVLAAAGPAASQPTNALPGQPPIVTNGVVLPDNTFVQSTWLQAASEFAPFFLRLLTARLTGFDRKGSHRSGGSMGLNEKVMWVA